MHKSKVHKLHLLSDFNINSTSFKNPLLRTAADQHNLRDIAATVGKSNRLNKYLIDI
jgi:hypothetical protein